MEALFDLKPVVDHSADFARFIPLTQGNIAEFGVYDGGSTVQLAGFGRDVYAFDTFGGIPSYAFDPNLDHDQPGKFHPTHDVVSMLRETPNVYPMIGMFWESFERQLLRLMKFGFVYLDADLYQSYREVLDWLVKGHLEDRFVILADDYQACKGARKAVNEFIESYACNHFTLSNGIVLTSIGGLS